MAFTVVADWKMEEAEAPVERATSFYTDNTGWFASFELEREVVTKIYRCQCVGTDDLPERQNPGNLQPPWQCMNRRFLNPRGGYKDYEEVWQLKGEWHRVDPEPSDSASTSN